MLFVISFAFLSIFPEDLSKILNELDQVILKQEQETEQKVIKKKKTVKKIEPTKKIEKKASKPVIKPKNIQKILREKIKPNKLNLPKKKKIDPVKNFSYTPPKKEVKKNIDSFKRRFFFSASYGVLFKREEQLADSFVADINANGGNLETIYYYNVFSIFFRYNITRFLSPILEISYDSSFNKSTKAILNYGLEDINTNISYKITNISASIGNVFELLRYKFFSLNLAPILSFSYMIGCIILLPLESSSLNIESSNLNFYAVSLGTGLDTYFIFALSRYFNMGLKVSYKYLEFNKIFVSNSSGEFSYQYTEGKQLAIYDQNTGTSENLNISFSGFYTGLFFEFVF